MLNKLKLTAFRCFRDSDFDFSSGINLITGDNGSGKSSVLEAIYFCARGRSFRTNYFADLVMHDSASALVYAELSSDQSRYHKLGCQIQNSSLDIRLDGSSVKKRSELLDVIPVQLITPVSHLLVDSGPSYRRKFIDWGLFHVEHHYRKSWSEFNRVLKQRNQALKDKSSQIKYWDEEFVSLSNRLTNFRKSYFAQLVPVYNKVLSELTEKNLATIDFRAGWTESAGLGEQLQKQLSRDMQLGYTQSGPHKADIRFNFYDSARNTLSRGQQKMVVFALQISQCLHLATQSSADPVLLIDDISSELDRNYQYALFDYLSSIGFQVFITAIEDQKQFRDRISSLFHVEHNTIK